MTVYEPYFPLGLGSSRFPISGPGDREGIDKSIELVIAALERGLNYIDSSYNYSAGMAQTVLKEALASTKKSCGVTVKVLFGQDKSAEDTQRRVELQLKAMGLSKASFFKCWTITTYEMFQEIMRKGGIYEGALKLKEEGLIEHICFSTHAQPPDIIKIIESGVFEAMTLSYSLLNSSLMDKVLDCALSRQVDVAVMNPLGGGLIAQNQDYFSFARAPGEKSIIAAALRYAQAHPAVKIILTGLSSLRELEENLSVFTEPNPEPDARRRQRVGALVSELKGFCTGCGYCAGCPAEIPIAEIMQKRNALLFSAPTAYNRSEPELVKNIKLFRTHSNSKEWFPETAENPCLDCGRCEEKCTQQLKIMEALADTYERAEKVGYSLAARKQRLADLLANRNYRRVGLYPNGGFANLIMELYEQFFGQPEFQWLQFNSDPKMWDELSNGLPIYSPEKIRELKPDIIIIGTYKYDQEIYESLKHYEEDGIKVAKLHRDTEVPWVF